MKSLCVVCLSMLFVWCAPFASQAQTDSLLLSLDKQDTTVALLPDRMVFTQRLLWGRRGALRITGLAPLTNEGRTRELKWRRRMLVTHQVLGYITLGGMVAQGIVGQQLYNNYSRDRKELHKNLATGVSISYFSTAALSLFAPPPLIARAKERGSTIRWHKRLALLHMAGMVTTLLLADRASEPAIKPIHRAAAFTAFGSFALSMVVITF